MVCAMSPPNSLDWEVERMVFEYLQQRGLRKTALSLCEESPLQADLLAAVKRGPDVYSLLPKLEHVIGELTNIRALTHKMSALLPERVGRAISDAGDYEISAKLESIFAYYRKFPQQKNHSTTENIESCEVEQLPVQQMAAIDVVNVGGEEHHNNNLNASIYSTHTTAEIYDDISKFLLDNDFVDDLTATINYGIGRNLPYSSIAELISQEAGVVNAVSNAITTIGVQPGIASDTNHATTSAGVRTSFVNAVSNAITTVGVEAGVANSANNAITLAGLQTGIIYSSNITTTSPAAQTDVVNIVNNALISAGVQTSIANAANNAITSAGVQIANRAQPEVITCSRARPQSSCTPNKGVQATPLKQRNQLSVTARAAMLANARTEPSTHFVVTCEASMQTDRCIKAVKSTQTQQQITSRHIQTEDETFAKVDKAVQACSANVSVGTQVDLIPVTNDGLIKQSFDTIDMNDVQTILPFDDVQQQIHQIDMANCTEVVMNNVRYVAQTINDTVVLRPILHYQVCEDDAEKGFALVPVIEGNEGDFGPLTQVEIQQQPEIKQPEQHSAETETVQQEMQNEPQQQETSPRVEPPMPEATPATPQATGGIQEDVVMENCHSLEKPMKANAIRNLPDLQLTQLKSAKPAEDDRKMPGSLNTPGFVKQSENTNKKPLLSLSTPRKKNQHMRALHFSSPPNPLSPVNIAPDEKDEYFRSLELSCKKRVQQSICVTAPETTQKAFEEQIATAAASTKVDMPIVVAVKSATKCVRKDYNIDDTAMREWQANMATLNKPIDEVIRDRNFEVAQRYTPLKTSRSSSEARSVTRDKATKRTCKAKKKGRFAKREISRNDSVNGIPCVSTTCSISSKSTCTPKKTSKPLSFAGLVLASSENGEGISKSAKKQSENLIIKMKENCVNVTRTVQTFNMPTLEAQSPSPQECAKSMTAQLSQAPLSARKPIVQETSQEGQPKLAAMEKIKRQTVDSTESNENSKTLETPTDKLRTLKRRHSSADQSDAKTLESNQVASKKRKMPTDKTTSEFQTSAQQKSPSSEQNHQLKTCKKAQERRKLQPKASHKEPAKAQRPHRKSVAPSKLQTIQENHELPNVRRSTRRATVEASSPVKCQQMSPHQVSKDTSMPSDAERDKLVSQLHCLDANYRSKASVPPRDERQTNGDKAIASTKPMVSIPRSQTTPDGRLKTIVAQDALKVVSKSAHQTKEAAQEFQAKGETQNNSLSHLIEKLRKNNLIVSRPLRTVHEYETPYKTFKEAPVLQAPNATSTPCDNPLDPAPSTLPTMENENLQDDNQSEEQTKSSTEIPDDDIEELLRRLHGGD